VQSFTDGRDQKGGKKETGDGERVVLGEAAELAEVNIPSGGGRPSKGEKGIPDLRCKSSEIRGDGFSQGGNFCEAGKI